jgi:hypothetical protein
MSNPIRQRTFRWSFCLLAAAILVGPLNLQTARTANAAQTFLTCSVFNLGAFPNKYVQVKCGGPGAGSIQFLVVPSNSPDANRVLSIASMAVLLKKTVLISYESDASGTGGLCNPNNCRVIQSIVLTL